MLTQNTRTPPSEYNQVMQPELKQKIDTYANNHFTAAIGRINEEANKKRQQEIYKAAKRGFAGSAHTSLLQIDADSIKESVLAKAEGLISGYELNGVPLDDYIVKDVTGYYYTAISARAGAMEHQAALTALRTGGHNFVSGVKQNLERMTQGVINEVVCLVEERKMVPKFKSQQHHITVHNTGHNSRANFNSVDTSNNNVSITDHSVFAQMRDVVQSDVPAAEQADLLERLGQLEAAIDKPTAMERYHQFVARAADYAALLPFLPRLLEMARLMVSS
jgi:hypothetical protein